MKKMYYLEISCIIDVIRSQAKGLRKLALLLSVLLMPLSANSQTSIDDISISSIKRQAEAGNVGLQLILGNYYQNGKRVEKDLQQAKYWYERAITGGNETAKPLLAMIYNDEKNYSKAYTLFLSYANNPQNMKKSIYGASMFYVGLYKLQGLGTPKDINGAIEWFEKVRAIGFSEGLTELWSCYAQINDTNKMFTTAKEIYDKIGLSNPLARSYLYGIGCKQDLSKVYEMSLGLANGKLDYVGPNGSSISVGKSSQFKAQLYIGIANYFDKDKTDHYKEAVRWLESVINSKESIEKDRGEAMCLLARCYRFGRGVEKNITKANELDSESKKLLPEDDYLKFISHFSASY